MKLENAVQPRMDTEGHRWQALVRNHRLTPEVSSAREIAARAGVRVCWHHYFTGRDAQPEIRVYLCASVVIDFFVRFQLPNPG